MTAYLDEVHSKSHPLLRSPIRWIRAVIFYGALAITFLVLRSQSIPTLRSVVVGVSALAAACLLEFILAAGVLVNRDLWSRLVNPRVDAKFARKMFMIRAVGAASFFLIVIGGYLIGRS
jgi:hypothetical protein